MNEEWQGKINNNQENKLLKKIDENTSMIADHVDQSNLKSIAK